VTGFLDLSTSMTMNDLKPPPTKGRGSSGFFATFNVAHILTLICDEMAGDIPRQPAYEIFSIKHRF